MRVDELMAQLPYGIEGEVMKRMLHLGAYPEDAPEVAEIVKEKWIENQLSSKYREIISDPAIQKALVGMIERGATEEDIIVYLIEKIQPFLDR